MPEVAAVVVSWLAADPALRELGGPRYVADLIDHAPPGADPRQLAKEAHIATLAAAEDVVRAGGGVLTLSPQREAAEALWTLQPVKWARPFAWRDPSTLPPRAWLYGGHYVRRFVCTTVAPGGLGKSSLTIVEALAMASGKALLGERPCSRLRVWLWNGEDPLEETERRVHATMLHYGLRREDVEGWLFIGSGREAELVLAEQARDGAVVHGPRWTP